MRRALKLAVLTALLFVPLLPTTAKEAWVEYQESTNTLTFHYDDNKSNTTATGKYSLNTGTNTPGWSPEKSSAYVVKVVFDSSFADARPTTLYKWFYGMNGLYTIEGIEYLNTSEVTNMSFMLYNNQLTSFDASHFDTSKVKDMNHMFFGCHWLSSLDLSSFNTENVEDMQSMFYGCVKLTSLNVSSFNTSKVVNMSSMFKVCDVLKTLDISSFNTEKVTNMDEMFAFDYALTTIYTGDKFVMSDKCSGTAMFYACTSMPGYDKNNTGKEKATYYSQGGFFKSHNSEAWIAYDQDAKTLSFYYDPLMSSSSAKTYGKPADDVTPGWVTDNLDIEKIVINMSFEEEPLTSCNKWFSGLSAVKSIEGLEYLNTSEIKNMSGMFQGMSSLTALDVSKLNTQNVTDMSNMFAGCSSLGELSLSNFSIEKVTTMNCMFAGCSALTSLDLSSFKYVYAKDLTGMLKDCSSLTELDLSLCHILQPVLMGSMFANCAKLQKLDLSHMHTAGATDMTNMFSGCSQLSEIDASDYFEVNTNKCDGTNMFAGCEKLTNYSSGNVGIDMAKYTTDGGYLTYKEMAPMPWVEYKYKFETGYVLTFHYDDDMQSTTDATKKYLLPAAGELPGWYNDNFSAEMDSVVFDSNFADARPTSCYGWFKGMSSMTKISGLEYLNTSEVTTMGSMFEECSQLTSLDLSGFDIRKVTQMSDMFKNCSSLETITTNDLFKPTDSSCYGIDMFKGCGKLTDYSESNVGISMAKYISEGGYFTAAPAETWVGYYDSTKLLTFHNDNTRKVLAPDIAYTTLSNKQWLEKNKDITKVVFDSSFASVCPETCERWFEEMTNLTTIEGLENLNTSEVTTMYQMFRGCNQLTSLDMSHFNTEKVENMSEMFHSDSKLTELDLSGFNTKNVTTMQSMFYGCKSLTTLKLTGFNTGKVERMRSMFNQCTALTSLDLTSFNVASVTDMYIMFKGCSSLKAIYVNEDFSVATNCNGTDMFSGCTGLNVGMTVDKSKANYKDGYLTLRRHFSVGATKYNVDGYEEAARCTDDVKFTDGEKFVSAFNFNFANDKKASYERAITSNWATLCLPFSFNVSDNDQCKFYEIDNIGDDNITVKEITGEVEAGKPVLAYATGDSIIVSNGAGASAVTKPTDGTYLEGTFAEAEVENAEGNYIISKNKFWNVASLISASKANAVKVASYRAYIKNVAGSAKAASLNIITDETDGISNVDDTLNSLDGAELYNLQGRRLDSPMKGMMIVKKGNTAKKIFIK